MPWRSAGGRRGAAPARARSTCRCASARWARWPAVRRARWCRPRALPVAPDGPTRPVRQPEGPRRAGGRRLSGAFWPGMHTQGTSALGARRRRHTPPGSRNAVHSAGASAHRAHRRRRARPRVPGGDRTGRHDLEQRTSRSEPEPGGIAAVSAPPVAPSSAPSPSPAVAASPRRPPSRSRMSRGRRAGSPTRPSNGPSMPGSSGRARPARVPRSSGRMATTGSARRARPTSRRPSR